MMKRVLPTSLVAFMILSVVFVSAISEDASRVESALKLAEKDMEKMKADGLPIVKYNDTLTLARQIFEAQLLLEKSGRNPDYSLVYEKIEELKEIRIKAYRALDELKALELTINQTKGIDLAPVLDLYAQAKDEFESERYDECLKLIDKTYEKISELEALRTKMKAFYEATSRSILGFLNEKKVEICSGILVSLAGFILTYNRVMCWVIERRIESLERRKKSIKKLIAKTQKEYFEDGKIGETTYHVRIKKFGELIRDINRQIPLLKEELTIRRKKRFF